MKVGWTYKWSIKIENGGSSCHPSVGIASSCHELNSKLCLGGHKGGWSYQSWGYVYHNNESTKPGLLAFGIGDIVTLKLDLSTNISNDFKSGGTLSAIINGNSSNEMILFDNIVQDVIDDVGMDFLDNDDGFYPAISVYGGSCLKFVGFDSVE